MGLEWGSGVSISEKLPGEADAGSPWLTSRAVRLWRMCGRRELGVHQEPNEAGMQSDGEGNGEEAGQLSP